ncbi:MAG: HesA/MoeB/ThiF family protein, partial [Usitatibacteraceae bacterium]
MDDQALLRYSRHILLNEFGIEAQNRMAGSRALVIGAGGLGSAALMYLASAGVGHIAVADGDTVDLTNLQRQIVHREDTVGMNKARSAQRQLRAINSTIRIDAIEERLAGRALDEAVANADIVLDCSDNFATRHAINRACVARQT